MNPSKYRQSASDFQDRLSMLAGETQRRTYVDKKSGDLRDTRVFIDTTGIRTTMVPGASDYTRIVAYGRRRYLSACRVFILLERVKKIESFTTPITVTHSGAYWQSVKGLSHMPACHTCPALLLLNNQLPILITTNQQWRHQIILAMSDCMLMPKWINDIDGIIDSLEGRDSFAETAGRLINSPAMDWQQAAKLFQDSMREYLSPLSSLTESNDQRILALQGFYEGMFLTSANNELNEYISELDRTLPNI